MDEDSLVPPVLLERLCRLGEQMPPLPGRRPVDPPQRRPMALPAPGLRPLEQRLQALRPVERPTGLGRTLRLLRAGPGWRTPAP